MNNNKNLEKIWSRFLLQYNLGTNHIPLFDTDNNLNVETIIYGKNKKNILKLSEKINNVFKETSFLVRENYKMYDGILYVMYCIRSEKIIPKYFGKTNVIGKTGKISSLLKGKSPKPRWDGDNSHTFELSKVVCEGYDNEDKGNQYIRWGEVLFEEINSPSPKLKEQVYLKTIPWEKSPKSLWEEYGGFTSGLQEYILIDLTQKIYPGELLNIEGVIKN